jgi:hypothetical protein
MLLGVLAVVLLLAVGRANAQSPPPTPVPPTVEPTVEPTPPAPGPEVPELREPTDLLAVLGWLAAGGAGPALAFFLAKQAWFQRIENSDVKLGIVLGCIVAVPLLAKLAIDLLPPELWAVMQPYWAVAIGALLIGWPVSQIVYERYLRSPEPVAPVAMEWVLVPVEQLEMAAEIDG